MGTQLFANAARGQLGSALSSGGTSISLKTGHGAVFPVATLGANPITRAGNWFKAVLQDEGGIEIVYVRTHTSNSDSFANVLRGQEGTSARAFGVGAVVGLRMTAADMAALANVPAVTQAEAEAGTVTDTRTWTPQRVSQAIAALASGGGGISVASIKALIDLTPSSGVSVEVVGFYSGSREGGGTFIWDSGRNKTTADGITIIDPSNIGGFDGTQAKLSAFLTAQGGGSGTGCWMRVIDGKLSVFAAGTVGDGVVNDTTAIQAAVDAAAGKCTCWFPAATYLVTASANSMPFPEYGGIRIPSYSHLQLHDNAVVQTAPNSLSKYALFSVFEADHVTFSGGKLIGDRETHTYPNVFTNVTDMNAGIWETRDNYNDPNSWADGVEGYIQYGVDSGTYVYDLPTNTWTKTSVDVPNYMSHEFGLGFSIRDSTNITVRDSTIINFTGDSVTVEGQTCDNIRILNNVLKGDRRQGISVVKGNNIWIVGNTIADIGKRMNTQDGCAPRFGIDLESGDTRKSRNVIISENIFVDCVGGAVITFDSDSTVVANNAAFNCGFDTGFGANCQFIGNVVYNGGISNNGTRSTETFTYTVTRGVIHGTPDGASQIWDGTYGLLRFLDTDGLVVYEDYYQITVAPDDTFTAPATGNEPASGNGSYGFAANNVSVVGNTLYKGQISLYGKNVFVKGNQGKNYNVHLDAAGAECSGNSIDFDASTINPVIRMTGSNTGGLVVGNTIRAPGSSTVLIRALAPGTLVKDNVLQNAYSGIQVSENDVKVIGNTLTSDAQTTTGTGISVDGSLTGVQIEGNTIRMKDASYAISSSSSVVVVNNSIYEWDGFMAINLGAGGNFVSGNTILTNKATFGGGDIGIYVSAGTGTWIVNNTIHDLSAKIPSAIDTSSVTGSVVSHNRTRGPIDTAAGDHTSGNDVVG